MIISLVLKTSQHLHVKYSLEFFVISLLTVISGLCSRGAFGRLEKLLFSCKLKCWAPRISWLGAFGLLVQRLLAIFLTP